MTISQNIGGLPVLSWIWDYGPWLAALIALVADFGMVCALMSYEGVPPGRRDLYMAFIVGNTIFLPLYAFAATAVLQTAAPFDGWFFTKTWWHLFVLALGFVVSFGIERSLMKHGVYSWSQQLSPSKLWHTFIAGVVFYWAGTTAIPVLMTFRPWWAMLLVLVAFVGYFGSNGYDHFHPKKTVPHFAGQWSWTGWHRTH